MMTSGTRRIFFSVIVILCSLTATRSFAQTNQSESNGEIVDFKESPQSVALASPSLSNSLAVVGIGVAFFLYWLKERSDKISTLQRSCDAILTEIGENHQALTTNKHTSVSYEVNELAGKSEIRYTNAYLDIDAYESILHSGLLTYFSGGTQNRLIQLYTRIKSHNEMITYTNEYEDEFFMADNSEERLRRWYQEIKRYDLILTKWDKEIVELLKTVEPMIKSERPTHLGRRVKAHSVKSSSTTSS